MVATNYILTFAHSIISGITGTAIVGIIILYRIRCAVNSDPTIPI